MQFQYNAIRVVGIDNAGRFMQRGFPVDTLRAAAVALELTLLDSAHHIHGWGFRRVIRPLSFAPAMATSWEQSFIPVSTVEQIRITTLLDINGQVRAGDDISELILYETGEDFELYHRVDAARAIFNRERHSPRCAVVMVLRIPIENSRAQFTVQVTLSDARQLTYSTEVFTIIP